MPLFVCSETETVIEPGPNGTELEKKYVWQDGKRVKTEDKTIVVPTDAPLTAEQVRVCVRARTLSCVWVRTRACVCA